MKYCGEASCRGNPDTLCAYVKFHWLFRLISGEVTYRNGEADWRIRAAWKQIGDVEEEAAEKREAEQTEEDGEETGDYIIADSGTKLLSDADISGLSAKQLNYAKNEIYARHGRKFDSKELQDYFNSKSWYNGQYEPDDFDKESDSILSDVEKKNAEFLKDAEQAAGGYSLDQ